MNKNNQKINGLSEKEQKELEQLDNPNIEFMGPTVSPLFSIFTSQKNYSLKARKERVIKLRVKMRLVELGLNPDNDFNEYYRIMEEEEKRFDERFKK
jgi:hypothetical protein